MEKDFLANTLFPRGFSKNLAFLFPFSFFFSGQKATCLLRRPPRHVPGRLDADKKLPAPCCSLSLSLTPSLSSLFLSEPRNTRRYPAAVIRRRRR